MVTRRRFLKISMTLGTVMSPAVAYCQVTNQDWKPTCRAWMQVLLPGDRYGPGADCPSVWARIEKIMVEQSDISRWILLSLNALASIKPPKEDYKIERLLRSDGPYAQFLRYFQELLLDSYYASGEGWKELGFNQPTQPSGYPIQ